MPKPFALTAKLLAKHGLAGRTLALPPAALGSMITLLGALPIGSERWALQGRRADARVWAPIVQRSAVATPPAAPIVKRDDEDDEDDDEDDEDDDEDDEEESSSSSMPAGAPVVRVVSVRGVLSAEAQDWGCGMTEGYGGRGGIVERMGEAHADPACVAIVFDATGPGGDGMGCLEAAAELAGMREQSGKPVLVWTQEATSAYYALACAAASPGGFFVAAGADVGNVGTRTWHVDRSEANAKDGVQVTHIGSPKGKVLGNPDAPLDPEALKRIQRDIDDSTARFAALVSAMRPGLTPAAVLGLDADTRRGQGAVDEGLADGVAASLSEVVVLAYQRAMAATRPAATTSSAGAPGPQQPPEDDMPLSAAVLSALGLKPGASSAAVEAAILARGTLDTAAPSALEALGRTTLEALGVTDPLEAMILAPRQLRAAAAAPAVEVERDELRRERAWSGAITANVFTAGEVWAQVQGPDGKRTKAYTTMAAGWNAAYPDVGQLEARLAKLPKLARGGAGGDAPDPAAAAAFDRARGVSALLSAKWVALAERAKVDPAQLAAGVSRNLGTSTEP